MTDELLTKLLAKPVGPNPTNRSPEPKDFTHSISRVGKDHLEVEIRDDHGNVNEGTALAYLEEEGLNPEEWEATHFKKIKYGAGLESVKFSYKRVAASGGTEQGVAIDELLKSLEGYEYVPAPPVMDDNPYGFMVLLGDMQFGSINGEGPAGTLRRTLRGIDEAADRLQKYRSIHPVDHVHVAWLGDHIEGFVSQGGANVWRTQLTLSEQIRLTRRVMLHALKTFAPLTSKLTMAAVPGNHGEPQRFAGKGVTRYDDSHDTESLIAIKDAVDNIGPEKFEHVEFFVPATDEKIVIVDVAGTIVAHHHGDDWRPNKAMDWWEGQSFNRDSPMHVADLLVFGHWHHEHYEANGTRSAWGISSTEDESTWFKHKTGIGGCPGIHVALTRNGDTPIRESIRLREVV